MKTCTCILRCLLLLALGAGLFLGAGCGKKTQSSTPNDPAAPDMEADLARTVKEQAAFYHFKTPADMPTNLKWESGPDVPEYADLNAKKGGTFNSYIQDFPRTLRTVGPDATGGIREYLLDWVTMGMVDKHPNLPEQFHPALAREWAVDLPGKTAYYRIDPTARWSDGVPVTTKDVVFLFYFMRSPHLNEPWYNNFYSTTYERITVYDDLTFAVTLQERKPDLLSRSAVAPYPRHAYKDFGPGWIERFQWRITPTTGAYTIFEKDIDRGRGVTFSRVKDWWARDHKYFRGRFNPDKLRLEVIRDPDKTAEAFARGDLDMFRIAVPKFWYETIPDTHPGVQAGYIVKTKFYNRIPRPDWGLWINTSKPPLNNLDVRLGINYATNFDLVCSQFFRGDAVRMQTRNDGFPFRTHPTLTARPFDPARAREYFTKAGFSQQGPDGILRNVAGQKLSFVLTTYRPEMRDLLAILKQEALKAGLELNLEVLDRTTGVKKIQEKNHEIALIALSRSPDAYPRFWELYHGSNAYEDAYLAPDGKWVDKASLGKPNPAPKKIRVNTNNMTLTFNPELDRLIETYDKAATMEDVKRLAAQMEQIIYDEASWVNGWAEPFIRGVYQRYIKWPEGFNVAQARYFDEAFLMWIDQDEKTATEEARRANRTFPVQVLTFDKFKE